MEKLIDLIETFNERLGKFFSWSSFALVLVIIVDVFMRYVMDRSIIWLVELEVYFFAFTFILAGAYAFKHDKHVRVDLYYSKWSQKRQAGVNLLGGLFLLLPWCIISVMVSWKYAMTSYKLGESSAQAGGLPALYILKFCIVLGFILLSLQGIATILKSINIITHKPED